jgi:phosphoglycerate kinase
MSGKYVIGNWKENPENVEQALELLKITEKYGESLQKQNIFVSHAVPNIFVGFLSKQIPTPELSLQNISNFTGGSHTGEISASQAKSIGIKLSIVGHSETRLSPTNPHGDEDKDVNQKLKNLFAEGIWATLCVGEYIRDEKYAEYITKQIQHCLEGIEIKDLDKLCLAYEPIWAIGKNATRVATDDEIVETIGSIKKYLGETYGDIGKKIVVLYGGSVDENNAKEILNLAPVDGLLVGRASSDKTKWEKLLQNISGSKTDLKGIKDLDIKAGDRVLLRLDYNVPINEEGKIENTFRIDESLHTIKLLQEKNAKVIIVAHRESGSLDIVAKYLLDKIPNFRFLTSLNHLEIIPGSVVLLENIRLDKREKAKEESERDELGKELASLADYYINDAFSASHRGHASITSVSKFLPSALGPNFIREVTELKKALNPDHPTLLIVGGAKFDTKLRMLEKFLDVADKIFVGGALAHSFWKAKGQEIGKSLLDEEVKLPEKVLKSDKILLPADVITLENKQKKLSELSAEDIITDFGQNTLKTLEEIAQSSKTIVWNGPLGFYEKGFDKGTKDFIKFLGGLKDKTIILGGGDTVAVVEKVLKESPGLQFTHVSGAGGAMIDFLSNGTLPGILAIK